MTLTAFIVAGAVHAVLLVWLSAQEPREIFDRSAQDPVLVTIVAIEPAPLPPPDIASPPIEEARIEPAPVPPQPERQIAQPTAPAIPSAQPAAPFTSLTDAPDTAETTVSPPTPQPAPPLKQAQAIEAIKRLDCARLKQKRPADCPPEDPFAAAEMAQIMQDNELTLSDLQAFGPQSALEQWAARNSGFQPTSIFGEDNSIFIDPMAEGAYNAQRIRNGESPIWDRDIEEQLREARTRN